MRLCESSSPVRVVLGKILSKKTKEATFVRKWHSAVAKSEKEKEKEKEREKEREREYISNSVWRHGQRSSRTRTRTNKPNKH